MMWGGPSSRPILRESGPSFALRPRIARSAGVISVQSSFTDVTVQILTAIIVGLGLAQTKGLHVS